METIAPIAEGLTANPTGWLLALSLFALAYMYRERAASQKELIDNVRAQEQAHRETLLRIVPISEKLVESVEVLERVTDALMKRTE